MPRKPKLTWEVIDQAEELLKEGHYAITVAQFIGVSEQTWYLWLQKGEEYQNYSDTELNNISNAVLYIEFYETVKRATATAEMDSVKAIKKAGKKSWQAHAWYLERKFRDRWGRPNKDDGDAQGDKSALDKFLGQVNEIANKTLDESDDE